MCTFAPSVFRYVATFINMVVNFLNDRSTKDVSINNNKEQDFSFAPSKVNALS